MQVEQELNKLNDEKERKEKEKPVSFEVVMAYAKYFLQHMDYLLLQQIDPLKKADFFSVIFNETPTYAEIASVTTNSGQNAWDLTGINELFKIKKDTPNPDVSFMVRQLDTVWNQFEADVCQMYEKMARLDFVMIAGEVTYDSREKEP
jgi:hypothetical protein